MQRTRGGRLAGCVASLLAAALVGCEEEISSQPLDEASEFALRVAQIVCEKAEPCCVQFGLPAITEECNRTMRNQVSISFIEAELDGRTIDLSARDTCIARFEDAATCEELPFPFELVDVCPELFSEIPEGAGAPGTECEGVYECASPDEGERDCLIDRDPDPTCVWFVPADEGDACNAGDGIYGLCGEELVCGFAEETGAPPFICRPPALPNEVCYTPRSCVEGYVCLQEGDGAFCREALGLGEPCVDTPDLCSFPNVCDVVMGVCASLPIVQTCQDAICSSELIEVCQ